MYGNNANKTSYGLDFPLQVPVPRDIVGFVIGKSGETIKRIQAETGAKVQFNMSKFNHFANRIIYMYFTEVELHVK